jgi:alpha-amylase/alpha-mannosidase (GH57 family)
MGKSYVALLWHFHQPPYAGPSGDGWERALPWVRLHAARDYYQMGYLAGSRDGLRATFNFTPVLLAQFDAYLEEGVRDRPMALSLRDPGRLGAGEAAELWGSCFDVDFRRAVKDHPRYFRLFRKYGRRESFSASELTDAAALFNLAWCGEIFRRGPLELEGGVTVDLAPLFEKGGGYTAADVEAIIGAQLDIMRAVVPLYRRLRDEGRVELSTTPFYHPILPLVHDSDTATLDRPGAALPRRFSWPADAREHVRRAAAFFEGKFGSPPAGMWPAEGAVSEEVLRHFEEAGLRWIASDEGVLALSGKREYDPGRPELLLQPYRVGERDLAIFFRHHALSDAVGFEYQRRDDSAAAAADFCGRLSALLAAARSRSLHDALATIILDGENAWSGYERQGVPFLEELYRRLAKGDVAKAVTFGEYLTGAGGRGVAPHPPESLDALRPLACASWIDEAGSYPGNDLGTWVGGAEENRAWELLGAARETFERSKGPAEARAGAREFLLAAEASDWFWWYGDVQGGGADEEFDRLFRAYVRAAYRALGEEIPAAVDERIAPRRVVWRVDRPASLETGDLLVVEWPRPGEVRFGVNGWHDPRQVHLAPAYGAMAGPGAIYRAQLLIIPEGVRRVEFTFRDENGQWLGYDFFIPVN